MVYRFACISASNVSTARRQSTSTRACELISDLLLTQDATHHVDIISLGDYDLNPCCMDGNCFVTGECERDPAFNRVYDCLKKADGIFLVCPHYAPFPSKLMMLLEKLEEIAYLNSSANPEYVFPLSGKPVGLIAHGGQGDHAVPYYQQALLEPLTNAFGSLRMPVVSAGGEWPTGVAFGVESINSQTDSVFVQVNHDWTSIRTRLMPLVTAVISAVVGTDHHPISQPGSSAGRSG